jgi:hypothetical protein
MGRTLPTSRRVLDELELEWQDYRRGLTGEEQALFDALWQKARAHASAMANQAPLDPMQAVFLGMLLELAKEVDRSSKASSST